jgi:hypothetical protein
MFLRRTAFLVVTAALALLPRVAIGDVQVSYMVDDKALKDSISGSIVTFQLWTDPACSTALATAPVTIDDVDVVERLKRFHPKGGVKPPATARLVESFPGLTPPVALFVTVTGPGITPVGGTCQLQYASGAGGGTSLPCASQVGNEVYFTGCNVNVRNGAGATATTNGLGNLVVGYNENPFAYPRSGSHTVVVGSTHGYSSYGGVVFGENNRVSAPFATVTGGAVNVSSGPYAAVSGGVLNQATNYNASVSGGYANTASGGSASVNGGSSNTASGDTSSVSGGSYNEASGLHTTVGGGTDNLASGFYATVSAGTSNTASGDWASVSGGGLNTANGAMATVAGGYCNGAGMTDASCFSPPFEAPTVSGGSGNWASGPGASISGGRTNHANGADASVSGGLGNLAGTGTPPFPAFESFAAPSVSGGYRNRATGAGASVSGGGTNIASGDTASVSGGLSHSSTGLDDWRAGTLFQDN